MRQVKAMKTIKIRSVLLAMAVMLALPSMAQWNNGGEQRSDRYATGVQTTMPTTTFRSTGTMVGAGSAYSSTPTLNADGTAAYGTSYYSPAQSGPRRTPGTPGGNPSDDTQQPIGDAPWLLILLLGAVYGIKVSSKGLKRKV